jgi:hypothetical protein
VVSGTGDRGWRRRVAQALTGEYLSDVIEIPDEIPGRGSERHGNRPTTCACTVAWRALHQDSSGPTALAAASRSAQPSARRRRAGVVRPTPSDQITFMSPAVPVLPTTGRRGNRRTVWTRLDDQRFGHQLEQARSLDLGDVHPVLMALIWHGTARGPPGSLAPLRAGPLPGRPAGGRRSRIPLSHLGHPVRRDGSGLFARPLDPFHGIYAAITRQSPEGSPRGGWFPGQRLTLEEALRGYTQEAAHAGFEEKHTGSLEPGKLADFLVLSGDIRKITPQELLSLRVQRTYLGGEMVFESRR